MYDKFKPAIIGGTGLEILNIFSGFEETAVNTPYGEPSGKLITGLYGGIEVMILSRHGRQHTIPPTQVNNRANIWALKEAGCTHIMASAACGSLRQHIRTGDLVFPDQFIDFTRFRINTFFDKFEPGQLKHTAMPDPFDKSLRLFMIQAARELKIPLHETGTIITIEGPRFSTRAESIMFQSWGADIINMTIAPEAILANEVGIPYAVAALSTDYDAWHDDERPVNWMDILQVFQDNVKHVTNMFVKVLETMGA
ncbi:MAG: S-methyl-5'-thioadenosine phosphorylase [Bacteroidales bacterium]|nr:S-methyl-5'-thioadenosine phosphorylase [Bacteroidales bacterium]